MDATEEIKQALKTNGTFADVVLYLRSLNKMPTRLTVDDSHRLVLYWSKHGKYAVLTISPKEIITTKLGYEYDKQEVWHDIHEFHYNLHETIDYLLEFIR